MNARQLEPQRIIAPRDLPPEVRQYRDRQLAQLRTDMRVSEQFIDDAAMYMRKVYNLAFASHDQLLNALAAERADVFWPWMYERDPWKSGVPRHPWG